MKQEYKQTLRKTLSKLPNQPGVYIFKNSSDEILYVGKAKNLKNRVTSYFGAQYTPSAELPPAKQHMIQSASTLDYIVTDTETESILLEATLIKKHLPPYNVLVRDTASFKYIKVDLDAPWPTVTDVRRPSLKRDGTVRYFGPFTSAEAVRQTLKLITIIFPYCTKPPREKRRPEACFNYRLGRCPGVCMGKVSRAEYLAVMEDIIKFLEGDFEGVVRMIETEMRRAAEAREFERAARWRDRRAALQNIMQSQNVVAKRAIAEDCISIARAGAKACANVFLVRGGRLIDKRQYMLAHAEGSTDTEALSAFVSQYYAFAIEAPRAVVLSAEVDEETHTWLRKQGVKSIEVPARGSKRKLLELGEKNAQEFLVQQSAAWAREDARAQIALEDLASVLGLPAVPKRIEVYDMSNIQGTDAVGVMIVFVDGRPKKSEYRKFTIRAFKDPNDVGMMAEVLQRRFEHDAAEATDRWPTPDLIILDGGKPQLFTIGRLFHSMKITVPLAAIAKQEEELFTCDRLIKLPKDSRTLHLIQHMRDEAHRFAIGFFRSKHRVRTIRSWLDDVPGIGPRTRSRLIKAFGSGRAVRSASPDEIEKVAGKKVRKILEEY